MRILVGVMLHSKTLDMRNIVDLALKNGNIIFSRMLILTWAMVDKNQIAK